MARAMRSQWTSCMRNISDSDVIPRSGRCARVRESGIRPQKQRRTSARTCGKKVFEEEHKKIL